LATDEERTLEYGNKALAVAGEGPSEARAHALNNIGAVKLAIRYPEGTAEVEESFAMSASLGLSHDQIRAAVNIGWSALYYRDLATAETWIERAYALSMEREMPTFEAYAIGARGLIDEMRGRWAEAEANARYVLDNLDQLVTARMVAESLLGRLQARSGHPNAKSHLLEGWELATQAGEIQRTGVAASALAEFVWIGGRLDPGIFPGLHEVLDECLEREPAWRGGDLAFWLYLIGELEAMPEGVAEPYRLAGDGEWEKAASVWEELGIPYYRAVVLAHGDTESKLEALQIFDELDAKPLAARLRSELTEAGVSGVPRGPTQATRDNPFGLTRRQMDVLRHMAKGLTNAEIADLLFVSTRTVDHHVSAILGKLAVSSRAEAVATAEEAGSWDR
jgi:DNA-binding CsgD family transcriptional regulator